MRLRRTVLLIAFLSMPVRLLFSQDANDRVSALMVSMTLEEKIGQMTQADYGALKGRVEDVVTYSLGSVLWGGATELPDITA
ncbi:MAG: hypothetical protein AABY75_00390, partial [Bacteroidota bacterium]